MSWFGYRNFDTPDNSVNNRAVILHLEKCYITIIIGIGKQLTNQHWSEIDIRGWVIKGLKIMLFYLLFPPICISNMEYV